MKDPQKTAGPNAKKSRFPPPAPADPGSLPGARHAAALEERAPPNVLVDSGHNVLHLSPSAGRFILHSAGPLSSLLPAIVRPELRVDLKLALTRAIEQNAPTVSHPTVIAFDGARRRVAMHVVPVPSSEHGGAQALVFFLDGGPAADEEPAEKDGSRSDDVRRRLQTEAALARSEQHLKVLLAELQHRVRNMLAVIRALAARTAGGAETVEEFAALFDGRLGALARTQVILTRSAGAGVDLETMVREELSAQAGLERQAEISGPDVDLSPKVAEVLALAIHEMTTNAVKHGALSAPDGQIEVSWTLTDEPDGQWLTLTWSETGVSIAQPAPRRPGFGTELIERRVPYELKGRGALQFVPGGVLYEIAFPLGAGKSILQTDAR